MEITNGFLPAGSFSSFGVTCPSDSTVASWWGLTRT